MMLNLNKSLCNAVGLTDQEKARLSELVDVFNRHAFKNAEKNKYYEYIHM